MISQTIERRISDFDDPPKKRAMLFTVLFPQDGIEPQLSEGANRSEILEEHSSKDLLSALSTKMKLEVTDIMSKLETEDLEFLRKFQEESNIQKIQATQLSKDRVEDEASLINTPRGEQTSQIEDELICQEEIVPARQQMLVELKNGNSSADTDAPALTEYQVRLFYMLKEMQVHLGKMITSISSKHSEKQ